MIVAKTLHEYLAEETNDSEPIVEGLLSRSEFVLLSATGKTGKSILASNLGLAIASGTNFLGFKVPKNNRVLIIQAEIAQSVYQERLNSMLLHFGDRFEEKNVRISQSKILLDGDGIEQITEAIVKYDPDVLILDPFYKMHRGDEDKASFVGPVLSGLSNLCLETGLACILVHHQGKQNEGRSSSQPGHQHRGSSSFSDCPSASWSMRSVSRPEGTASISFEMRNRVAPGPVGIKLNPETLVWEVDATTAMKALGTPMHVVFGDALKDGPLSYDRLTRAIETITRKSTRTAQGMIRDGRDSNLLVPTRNGKETIYSLNCLDPQFCNLLEKCRCAEMVKEKCDRRSQNYE